MTTAAQKRSFAIRLCAGLAGYCTFINLYSPQAVLPMLSVEFGATAAQIATIMTASSLAVALSAPFAGTVADVLGRKRVIVTAMFVLAALTLVVALSPSLHALVVSRFVLGLAMPAVFAVMVAYIGDELTAKEATAVAGLYTSGASLGGFSGRFFAGIFSDIVGWRYAFAGLGLLTLAGAIIVMIQLPRERKFVRSEGLLASSKQMLQHFRNPQLVATYSVGFGVLFSFICIFTYVSFRLAAAPYNLSPTMLGVIFLVYLVGAMLTPWTGWAVARFGRRHFIIAVIALWIIGNILTLASPLWVIIVGLMVCAGCGLLCQSVSTGFVTITAHAGRSSAVGLYVTSFYLGGSFGATLGGIAWTFGGWPACVALVEVMLAIMGAVVALTWTRNTHVEPAVPVEPP
jgi:predicted MFS family arabinose efflux permease